MTGHGRVVLIFAAGLLAACSASPEGTPTIPPADTAAPTSEVVATPVPTLTRPPTDAPLDEVYDTPYPTPASPTDAPTAPPERCSTEPDTAGLDALTWTEIDTPSGTLRQLTGLDDPVLSLDPGPDGRWWVVTLLLARPAGALQTAVLLVDTQGGEHRWLNRDWWETLAYEWLPDGRLLWFDTNGCIFLREEDEVRLLGDFDRVFSLQPAANDVVFMRPGFGEPPYRGNLTSGAWELVDYQPVENRGYEVSIAGNGSYGLIFEWLSDDYPASEYRPLRIPARMGAPTEELAPFTVEIVGRGGGLTMPQTQLDASSYWYNPLGVWSNQDLPPIIEGYLVNIATGDLLGEAGFDLPEGMHIWGYEPSPDGRWLALILIGESEEYTGNVPGHLLIVSAADLESGSLFEIQPGQRAHHSFLNWHPDGALVQRAPNGELVVQQLPVDAHPTAALVGAGEWVANLPGRILTSAPDAPATARLYHLSSAFLGELDLSPSYGLLTAAGRSGDMLYLGAATTVNTQNAVRCPCALVEWPVTP